MSDVKYNFPPRFACSHEERIAVQDAFDYYEEHNADPAYQGYYEKQYTDLFCRMMYGGYADSVATGTTAILIALQALQLPKGSRVLCSPITDPGTINAIIFAGYQPKLIDSHPHSYNIGASEFEFALDESVKAAVIVHAMGHANEMSTIMPISLSRDIPILEDCSQAHFATHQGLLVGAFGDIAAFSTMNRKVHITGGCGGLVYTRSRALYQFALAYADRGKPRWRHGFDDRNPEHFLFPALNLHNDELSCAIGYVSLSRLPQTISARLAFVELLSQLMCTHETIFEPLVFNPNDSPFALPIFVKAGIEKLPVATALLNMGVPLNPHYRYLCADWSWLKPYLPEGNDTPTARAARDRSFVLYLNENYGKPEAEDIWLKMLQVNEMYA